MKTIQIGENVLIDLMIQDGKKAAQKVVVVRDLQIDPIKDQYIHADLFEVVMDEEISVEVPIVLVGKPEGVKMGGVKMGGVLEQITREITVECLPADIPQSIDVNVSHLNIGDTIHIGDIGLEKGKILVDATTTPKKLRERLRLRASGKVKNSRSFGEFDRWFGKPREEISAHPT
jgi:large subunit ribosomal protein L25